MKRAIIIFIKKNEIWLTITENHSCLPKNWSWKICSYRDNYLLHKNTHICLLWKEEEQIFLDILFTSEKTSPTAPSCFLLKKEEREGKFGGAKQWCPLLYIRLSKAIIKNQSQVTCWGKRVYRWTIRKYSQEGSKCS